MRFDSSHHPALVFRYLRYPLPNNIEQSSLQETFPFNSRAQSPGVLNYTGNQNVIKNIRNAIPNGTEMGLFRPQRNRFRCMGQDALGLRKKKIVISF